MSMFHNGIPYPIEPAVNLCGKVGDCGEYEYCQPLSPLPSTLTSNPVIPRPPYVAVAVSTTTSIDQLAGSLWKAASSVKETGIGGIISWSCRITSDADLTSAPEHPQ